MITIIHGDDTASSRSLFISQKNQHKDAISFSGEILSLTDLIQSIEGGGLFREEKHIFIDELLFKKKQQTELKEIITYLNSHQLETDTILWENKSLTKSVLSFFPKATVKHFPLPQSLFQFLDAIVPGNGKTLVLLFHKTITASELQIVVFMLVRHVRLLLAMLSDESFSIDEVKRLAPWQKGKLARQAKLFTHTQLLKIHRELFSIDLEQKTGKSALTLPQAIDFFLLGL